VAYYATPYEMVTKLWLVPTAVIGVLFPAFATSMAQDRGRAALLFGQGVKYTFLALFPFVLLITALAHDGLDLWLGAEFAQNSTHVLQLLAVGVFVSSLAYIPVALVQGAGRPDLTAKLHLVELPFYLLALWWLLGTFGIEGAAVAWVVRIAVDALVLFAMAQRFLPASTTVVRRAALVIGTSLLALALAALPAGLAVKGLFLSLTLLAFALAAWFLILAPAERAMVQKRLSWLPLSSRGHKL
jgi:O-antigen/teichoic acid export membrane protein